LSSGLSLVIVIAGTIGATASVMLQKPGVDPALATGPITTTSNDVVGWWRFL